MNYFNEILGLVTKNDPHTENGGLFLAHYVVLRMMLGLPVSPDAYHAYQEKMANSFVQYGLYLRSKEHKERTVSQDEHTGFSVASYVLNTSHRFQIWNYLIKHWFNYPATKTMKFYNPGSYYAWAVLADSKISIIFAPWYTINLLISSNKPANDTSSKLIYTDELYCIKQKSFYGKILWSYFEWRMKLMYGDKWVKVLYDIYFSNENMDHPLRQLAEKL